MKNTPLRRVGARKKRELQELIDFRDAVRDGARVSGGYLCERCGGVFKVIEAHHLCSRSRGVGHDWLHDPARNGCALDKQCHDQITIGTHQGTPDKLEWLKTRVWLNGGGLLHSASGDEGEGR